MYNSITNAENLKEKSGGGDEPEITADHMRKWNKLIDFAKEKGYSGNRDLDHDPILRKKVFDEYNKANPNDSIPMTMVLPIQNEIQKYKAKTLEEIKGNMAKGINQLAPGSTVENFMKDISQVDGIFGQYTSKWKFPLGYFNGGKVGLGKFGKDAVKGLIK